MKARQPSAQSSSRPADIPLLAEAMLVNTKSRPALKAATTAATLRQLTGARSVARGPPFGVPDLNSGQTSGSRSTGASIGWSGFC